MQAWQRFREAPRLYPGISGLLRKGLFHAIYSPIVPANRSSMMSKKKRFAKTSKRFSLFPTLKPAKLCLLCTNGIASAAHGFGQN